MKSDKKVFEYKLPVLDENGAEVVSDVSLVAIANPRELSLGARIARYVRTPEFQQKLKDLQGYDGRDDVDDFEDEDGNHVNPMSPYEERYGDIVQNYRKKSEDKKKLDDEEKKKKAEEKRKAQKALYREIAEELKREGSVPPEDTRGA